MQPALTAVVLTLLTCTHLAAQNVHRLAGRFDSAMAPTAEFFPGLEGSFRQQILIDARLLTPVVNKRLTGIRLRASDYDYDFPLKGGVVDYVVKASTTSRVAIHAATSFAKNAPATTQQEVFRGAVTVPTAPRPGAGWVAWRKDNSFMIPFTKPFLYRGRTLVLDIEGRQRVKGLPDFWLLAATMIPSQGQERNFGKSCTWITHTSGHAIHASSTGLVLGGMFQAVVDGRTECRPMMMIGAQPIPTGIDLSPMGATGCRQYVVPFLITPTTFSHVIQNYTYKGRKLRYSGIRMQIPVDLTLLGAKFYLQGLETQVHMPRKEWDNAAGLVLTDGLEIRIASQVPSSGMAVVRSHSVERTKPMPREGGVKHEYLPVMRVLYR